MNASVIDAFEFCRLKERREGNFVVTNMHRLAEDTLDKSGTIHWSLQGGSNCLEHPTLKLSVSGTVQLMCQRCLKPFSFDIDSESTLVLAEDEESVDAIDALVADDTVDVIAGSKSLNIAQLIEDEALLALPLSPKHSVCPDQAKKDISESERKTSPFAILKSVKK
jgi:uncharacterized protein